MKLWRVELVMRNHALQKCYAAAWATSASSGAQAIQATIADLHLDGVDVIEQKAEPFKMKTAVLLGPAVRAPEYES